MTVNLNKISLEDQHAIEAHAQVLLNNLDGL